MYEKLHLKQYVMRKTEEVIKIRARQSSPCPKGRSSLKLDYSINFTPECNLVYSLNFRLYSLFVLHPLAADLHRFQGYSKFAMLGSIEQLDFVSVLCCASGSFDFSDVYACVFL